MGEKLPLLQEQLWPGLIDGNPVISQSTWDAETARHVCETESPASEPCKYGSSCSYWHLNSFLGYLSDNLLLVMCHFSKGKIGAVLSDVWVP